jgi:glycosyltransferase involved in cell wall biosynthesis
VVQSVLLIEVDLFRSIGGGQTVYGALIRRRPEVQFYYFARSEASSAPRPSNAHAIPLGQAYPDPSEPVPEALQPFFGSFRTAMDLARSVADAAAAGAAPARFDVVDTPDYRYDGLFIRYALQAHGVEIGLVALALHGVLSSAFVGAWPWSGDAGRLFAELHLRERLQYRAADVRYGLSESYVEALERRSPLGVNRLDPMAVIRAATPTLSPPVDRSPDLAFIGRKERRKGPDLLLDALWWAPEGTWRSLRLIGPDGENHQGRGSAEILAATAAARRLQAQDEPGLPQAALQALCRDKTVVVAPSRYDQFNLVALESLLDACPTFVSRNTGVARWMLDRFPQMGAYVDDFGCDRSIAARLHDLAQHYDRARADLAETLDRADLRPDLGSVQSLYAAGEGGDARVQRRLHAIAERLMLHGRYLERREGRQAPSDPILLAGGAAAIAGERLRSVRQRAGRGFQRRAPHLAFALQHPFAAAHRLAEKRVTRGMTPMAKGEVKLVGDRSGVLHHLARAPERTAGDLERKILYLNQLVVERRTDRARWFAELARLERVRGNVAVAAAYDLRLIRWLGADRFQALPQTLADLRSQGYTREAEVAEALYSRPAEARARAAAAIAEQRARWKVSPERPLERLEDRRRERPVKVSVIVSLYNAADKLPRFLRMLENQTLLRAGGAEVVLVDSGSPADERAVFEACWGDRDFVVYARSAARETIQAAWNRGIRLARGEHLAFLGVDEGLRPDGLERLSRALDDTPAADWAMADALVTEVDRQGVFDRDVMVYDREGYRQSFCYLDSTYLAYVGGLYRRNLHDRFGWYDEDFRAAGDTEFKNRILPYIRTVRVPERLGVFNNYPDDRASQSPRAEIEDLRAWYLHRSEAGVDEAFGRAPEGEVRALLAACFSYRKCYATHLSTDLDLALSLARHLNRRSNGAEGGMLAQALAAASEDVHQIELWRNPDEGVRAQYRLATLLRRIRTGLGPAAARVAVAAEAVQVFNDNRYEQHHWSWSRP